MTAWVVFIMYFHNAFSCLKGCLDGGLEALIAGVVH